MQYGKIITKLGYDARFQDFKVQNIVGSTDVKFPIRLEGLAYSHAVFASVSADHHACDPCHAALLCADMPSARVHFKRLPCVSLCTCE